MARSSRRDQRLKRSISNHLLPTTTATMSQAQAAEEEEELHMPEIETADVTTDLGIITQVCLKRVCE